MIELHGNIMREKCSHCHSTADHPANLTSSSEIPVCPHCGGLYRPDVIWFGETLPHHALETAWYAAENCDLFLSIGTSAVVQPAASLPLLAYQNGARIIELNPSRTPVTPYAHIVMQGPSGATLPNLITKIWGIDLDSD
jgi:NAD-dependent deacetylase